MTCLWKVSLCFLGVSYLPWDTRAKIRTRVTHPAPGTHFCGVYHMPPHGSVGQRLLVLSFYRGGKRDREPEVTQPARLELGLVHGPRPVLRATGLAAGWDCSQGTRRSDGCRSQAVGRATSTGAARPGGGRVLDTYPWTYEVSTS